MRVGEGDYQLLSSNGGALANGVKLVIHFLPPRHAMVESNEKLLFISFQRYEQCYSSAQRLVDTSSAIVFCRTPHAMINVCRRRNVTVREGKATATLWSVNVPRHYFWV